MYYVKTKEDPVLAQNRLLAMSVLNLLSKDDILVYQDMLSILTPDINFRILQDTAKLYFIILKLLQCYYDISAHANARTLTPTGMRTQS